METPFKPLLSNKNRISIRLLLACFIISGTGLSSFANPDDLIQRSKAHILSSWNLFGTSAWEDEAEIFLGAAPVALSCIPEINISLGQGGFAVIDALTLVNAPDYPAFQYDVDIMGPLNDTVFCEQLGQELMVVVTEIPTGNSCMSSIFIEDKLRPTLVCLSDTLPCNIDIQSINFEDYIESVTDNCDDNPTLWYSYVIQNLPCNPHHFTQQILVTWTATDDSGNSATCQDVIYLRKPALGQIVFPPNISISCVNADTDPSNTGEPTFNGEPLGLTCQIIVFHNDQVIPMCNGARKILRTWTVKDWCTSGMVTHVQEILVVDNTPPVITCPPNLTINTGPAVCTTKYTLPLPVVSDLCATPSQIDIDIFVYGIPGIFSPGQMVTLGIGTTSITMRATDPCGNSSQCNYIVTVRDNTPPVLVCPPNVTVGCTDSTDPSNTGTATAIDACDSSPDVTYTDATVATQGCALGYRITRTWKATDNSGNMITCMQMITLTDNIPPVISCPPNTTISCTASTSPGNNGSATATDSCDDSPAVTFSDVTAAGGCPQDRIINRTWIATDDCGNSSTCLQQIFIEDNVPPVITCPPGVTINCEDSTAPANTGSATATDNCDPNPLLTFSDTNVPAGPHTYTINRIWTATDHCGNSSTCLQMILVHDDEPPTITCPANLTVSCTASTLPPATGSATATDNCDPTPLITFADVTVGGACPQERTITRTWTATDACGNSSTCIQIIVVDDNAAPSITCPVNVTIECTASTLPANTGSATATDICDSSPLITFADVTVGGSCPQERTITRTWTATDDCGNSSSCVQTIVVNDSAPPAITCPANITILCTQSTMPATTGNATATDLCDNSPAITFTDVTVAGICAQEFTINRTWRAQDDCGNSSTCVQSIVINDNAAPTITCPPNLTIACTASTLPPSTGSATATDNCTGTPTIGFSDVTVGGACPQERTITRTWTASDGCGNSSSCVQIIVVDDSLAPLITCPPNVTIGCTASTAPAATGSATATDNCDSSPAIAFTDVTVGGACPQERTITRTWTATDDCGNSSSCIQTIVVDDSAAPVITCPANLTIECSDSTLPASTGTATATDICDSSPLVTFSNVTVGGPCPQEFTISRTWIATDDCGNSSSCVQTIVVNDSTAPVITCPANMTIECTASTLPASTGTATATDLCDNTPGVTFTDITTAGGCEQEYTITRTWIATDDCGNSSTCNQTIAVQDNTAPLITCPDDVTIDCLDSTLPDFTGTATATDNCADSPVIEFTDVTGGGSCEDGLIITRTWTATDGCGNTSSCTQIIVAIDNTAPVISCPPAVTIECDESSQPDNTGNATASDSCDDSPLITHSDVTVAGGGGCADAYTITRTWIATDECGNSSSCIQAIFVDDNTAPLIACPDDVTLECGDSTLPENTGTATASDNCDSSPSVDFNDVTFGNGCPDGYTITRTWIATDNCGNTGVCTQTIVIDDNQAPLVNCPANLTIDCEDSSAPASTGMATANDSCDENPDLTFSDAIVSGACPQEFTIVRTWVATDNCGNSATCNQTIGVEDTTAPVCSAMDITVALNGNGFVIILASQVDDGSSDNCGTVTLSVSPNSFDCEDLGENIVTLTVTDCPGNSSTCTATVTVEDNSSLQAICQNLIIFLDENGNASIDPGDVDNGSGGGCGGGDLEFDLSQTEFNCTDLGQNIVTLTVTDEDGNTATCTAIITVDELFPPEITCPANLTVDCHEVTDPDNTDQFGNATATDNCPGVFITETHVVNIDACNVGTIVRTFTATDASGNTASCTQTITVSNPNPLDENDITWPDSPINVNICNSTDPDDIPNGIPEFDPTAVLCAGLDVFHVDQVQTIIDNNPNTPCKIISRTWTVIDECQPNGTFIFVQTINVQDPTPPVFTNINDMTKTANNNCVASFTLIASATDCAGVTITNNSPYGVNTGANASGNYPIGVTVVIFTATDGCGNISTMDVVITVIDPDPTQMMCEKTLIFLPPETEITIPADTFATILEGNCTDASDVIVSYSGTDPFDTLNTYDCGDVGVSTFDLFLWNSAGTMLLDSCHTADLDLRDPLDFCQDGLVLFGNVENEEGLDVSGVQVSITNAPMIPDTTNQAGQYLLNGLQQNTGYNVAPYDDDNHREGVSTLDLVMIQKHLLGKAKLNSPYKIIAADANNSGTLTALDLLEIRKLILGITDRFAKNTSWRFVDREFSFTDPYNPFTPPFPESIWIDSVTGGTDTADFVGIKIGDVNGSYFHTRATSEQVKPRTGSTFGLSFQNDIDPVDQYNKWKLMALPGQGKINGMQFRIENVDLTTEQIQSLYSDFLTPDQWFYNSSDATFTVSWSSEEEVDLTDKVIFSLPYAGYNSAHPSLTKPGFECEAYSVTQEEVVIRDIDLFVEEAEEMAVGEYQLFQNVPNPFSEYTQIRYSLPNEEMVTLVIHDLTGRQIYRVETKGNAGLNEISIRNRDLLNTGIYYYTLYTQNASLTRKMSFSND